VKQRLANSRIQDRSAEVRWFTPFFWIIFLFGAALRFWNYGKAPLWLDEFLTYWIISGEGWASLFERLLPYHKVPPLYFLMLKGVAESFGHTEWILRLPSVIFSLLIMVQLYRLGRYLFTPQAGCYAMLFCALAERYLFQAQNARPYSMGIFFYLLAIESFFRWSEQGERKHKWMFIAFSSSALYTHFMFLPFLTSLIPFFFLNMGGEKYFTREKRIRDLSQMFILPVLFLLPMSGQLLTIIQERKIMEYMIRTTLAAKLPLFEVRGCVWGALSLILAASVLAGLSRFRSTPHRFRIHLRPKAQVRIRYLLFWWLIPLGTFALLTALIQSATLSEERYLMMYALPFYLILGQLVNVISPPFLRLAFLMPYLISATYPLVTSLRYEGLVTPRRIGWKEPIEMLNREARVNEPVLLYSAYTELKALDEKMDPLFWGYINAPLSDMYLKAPVEVLAIGFPWKGAPGGYHQNIVLPKLRVTDHFWLMTKWSRTYKNEIYVGRFLDWLRKHLSARSIRLVSEFPHQEKSHGFRRGVALRKYEIVN